MINFRISILFTLILSSYSVTCSAETAAWSYIIHKDLRRPSMANFAERNYRLFDYFLKQSLHGAGKKDFFTVSKRVKNNIYWKGKQNTNIYIDAFRRSYPIIKSFNKRPDIPEIVFLIPYLESLWQSKSGKTSADYGYWQLVLPIVKEIQSLDTTSQAIKKANADTLRSDPKLSSEVALIHLRRYYFYFAKVAKYSETDAWLFAILAYNWGAGNVKRMLASMQSKQIKTNFSHFYHYLYTQHLANKEDKSMKAAIEYLPNLWNIAKIIRQEIKS